MVKCCYSIKCLRGFAPRGDKGAVSRGSALSLVRPPHLILAPLTPFRLVWQGFARNLQTPLLFRFIAFAPVRCRVLVFETGVLFPVAVWLP